MKAKKLEMQCQKKQQELRGKILPTAALFGVLLGASAECNAQNTSNVNDGATVTEVTQVEQGIDTTKTISLESAMQEVECSTQEQVRETISQTPTKFTISTGVGYGIGGDVQWVNRIQGSGEIFQGTPFSTKITCVADLDDPMHSNGGGKVILGKNVYKGITLDGDYTFTGTGGNIFRFGLGYEGKIGNGAYGVKLFPLNTNESPISAKVFVGGKVGKNGGVSSFVLVDFDKKSYYGETEYTQKLAEGIALFVQARLGGRLDGDFGTGDSQHVLGGFRFDLK